MTLKYNIKKQSKKRAMTMEDNIQDDTNNQETLCDTNNYIHRNDSVKVLNFEEF